MLVVDTNVLAYLLIEGDRTAQAQRLYRGDAEWVSDGFIFVEFANVLATYERVGTLAPDKADQLLLEAQSRVRSATAVPMLAALRVARRFSVSAYDACFLAAADALGGKLVTEDTKLRTAAPAWTQSIAEAITVL